MCISHAWVYCTQAVWRGPETHVNQHCKTPTVFLDSQESGWNYSKQNGLCLVLYELVPPVVL